MATGHNFRSTPADRCDRVAAEGIVTEQNADEAKVVPDCYAARDEKWNPRPQK